MNEKKITELLNAGYSISEVAKELEVDNSKIYYVAKKFNLPYNNPIKDGGPKEKRILRLDKSGFTSKDIGRIFSIAPINIEKVIKKNKK